MSVTVTVRTSSSRPERKDVTADIERRMKLQDEADRKAAAEKTRQAEPTAAQR